MLTFISSKILTTQLTWKLIEKKRPRRRKPRLNKSRPANQIRNFDSRMSNIPKSRGALAKALEKYVSLAQDAFSNGDRIVAESYYQYAEHYQRVLNETDDENKFERPDIIKSPNGSEIKPSRTQRAIEAQNQRNEKNDVQQNPRNENLNIKKESETTKEQKGEKKYTSDGLEALKPFEV